MAWTWPGTLSPLPGRRPAQQVGTQGLPSSDFGTHKGVVLGIQHRLHTCGLGPHTHVGAQDPAANLSFLLQAGLEHCSKKSAR